MTRPIGTVKPEIRILGIDTCRESKVFCAIVRGGLYLDGVFSFPTNRNGTRPLGEHIVATKYYPELRAVMLHDPRKYLVASTLEQTTKLPVISIPEGNRAGTGTRIFRSQHGTILQKSRLADSLSDKILSVAWTYGALPEPIRVTHLLARASQADFRA